MRHCIHCIVDNLTHNFAGMQRLEQAQERTRNDERIQTWLNRRNDLCSRRGWSRWRGVEVTWEPSTDAHWLSYYEIRRDGSRLDRVAKGCFYFDHSAGANAAALYEIVAVDGSGNTSVAASGEALVHERRTIVNDSDTTRLAFAGPWQSERDKCPAHGGTLSYADQQAATSAFHLMVREVVWHSRLGAEGELARITLDGGEPVTSAVTRPTRFPVGRPSNGPGPPR